MISASEVIGTYKIIESVGIGAFSEVFKATHILTGETIAIKKIDRYHERTKDIQKEVLIHKNLKHSNIIQFIESFEFSGNFYIVQEFAEGGELFEQIEPDIGFPEQVAHFYFVQLIRSIDYLHTIGVCHRDLKPENLLLDGNGNLKLADFGLSTLFRRGNSRRTLSTRCGTPVYMSPEVARAEDYEGDDADIWSCCIILIVLLTGNLPWKNSNLTCPPHSKVQSNTKVKNLPNGPKRIVKEILKINPVKRWKISDIISDPWFIQSNPLLDLKFMAADPDKLIHLIRECSSTQIFTNSILIALTQPDQFRGRTFEINNKMNGFSQPHSALDSEINFTDNSRVFVRNSFARFLCHGTNIEDVSNRLEDVLKSMLVPFQKTLQNNFIYYFQTVDRLKCPLVGQFLLHFLDDNVLVILKKNRGNPIEYARFFKFIVDQFMDIL